MRGGHNQHSVLEGLLFAIRWLISVDRLCISGCFLLQALEEAKLDLSILFLAAQEKLTHWAKILTYIGSTGLLQEFQHVVGRVSTSVLVSLFDIG